MDGLTVKQKRFVEAYTGNATEAAVKAGYSVKTAYAIGQENLKKPVIISAIQTREKERMGNTIADRKERQEFWTSIMRDQDAETKDRTRASELLGKSEGDFLDRTEVTDKSPRGEVVIFRIPDNGRD